MSGHSHIPFAATLSRALIMACICSPMIGCGPSERDDGASPRPPAADSGNASASRSAEHTPSFADVRSGFVTRLIRQENIDEPAAKPPPELFTLTQYDSPIGPMDCYIGNNPTPDEDTKHPAIIWKVGGFANSISASAWEGGPRDNYQSASVFREAGIVMMYPSLRGGNGNPGSLEGLFGEVDDILAAAQHLAAIDYVDPERIYLGGHSVGGTLVLLAAAADPERFRAVFSFGPIHDTSYYGQENVPFDVDSATEARVRAPIHWLHAIRRPTFVFEGGAGNIDSLQALQKANNNALIRFFPVTDTDHFSVLRPVSELIAEKILADDEEQTDSTIEISADEVADRIAHIHAPPRQAFSSGDPATEVTSLEFGIYYTPEAKGNLSPVHLMKKLVMEEFRQFEWTDKPLEEVGDGWASGFLYENVSEGYAPPSIDSMQYFGRGINDQQAEELQTSETALILLFRHPQSKALSNLKAANRLVDRIAAETGGYPWDEETRRVFSRETWRKLRVESWNEEVPDASTQIALHAFQDGDYLRAISLGMSKFGLPDIVVDQFPRSNYRSVSNLINLTSQALIEGATVGENGNFTLDLKSIRTPAARDSQLETLSEGATGKAVLALKKGAWDLGDPVNALIEIGFDHASGPDLFARQDALLTKLFGSTDSITNIQHNDALEEASAAARKKLPGLRKDFQNGLEPGELILVKAPFPIPGDAGNNEWMWVEISKWNGDAITGTLQSEPFNIPDLQAGQEVSVSESDVFDYIRRRPGGEIEGNTTGEIIRKMQQAPDSGR